MFKTLLVLFSSFSFAASFIPKEFEANLEQIVKRRLTKSVVKQPLVLKYKYPKNISMKLENMTYICNSETTWRYTPPFIKTQKGDVTIGKSSKYCFSTIFDALRYGFEKNSVYSVVKDEKKSVVHFNFSQRAQDELGIRSIEFKFDKKINDSLTLSDVKLMTIKHQQITKTKKNEKSKKKITVKRRSLKKDIVYTVKNVKTNTKFKSSDFVFDIPKNTTKTYMK